MELTPDLQAFIILLNFVFCCVFKVCDWLYPLTSDTPVLLANSGIYMFPDSLAGTPGSFVGIVLSSELPAAGCETFKDLLSQLVDLRIQVSLYFLHGESLNLGSSVAGVEKYI